MPEAQHSLRYVSGPAAGSRIYLHGETASIGRRNDNDVVLADEAVSRTHALLWHHDERWEVIDLNSHNGILVNGEPVLRLTLHNGDIIRLGHSVLRFERHDASAHESPRSVQELWWAYKVWSRLRGRHKVAFGIVTLLVLLWTAWRSTTLPPDPSPPATPTNSYALGFDCGDRRGRLYIQLRERQHLQGKDASWFLSPWAEYDVFRRQFGHPDGEDWEQFRSGYVRGATLHVLGQEEREIAR